MKTWADKERDELSVLRDLLSLAGKSALISELRQWNPRQRVAAEKWAAAVHLRASDNPVRVPKMPPHVKRLPEEMPF